MKQNFFSVLEKAKTSSALTPEDLVTLLSATEEQIPQLMAAADGSTVTNGRKSGTPAGHHRILQLLQSALLLLRFAG